MAEDFRDNVMERYDKAIESKERAKSSSYDSYWGTRKSFAVTKEMMRLLHQACKKRNISVSGYMRRCLAAQVAEDLGMPVEEVLKLSPYPAPYGKRYHERHITRKESKTTGRSSTPDDGEGYGVWPWT